MMCTTGYALTLTCTLLTLAAAPGRTDAQPAPRSGVSLTTGIAMTSQYDDETHLGRGVALSIGASSLVWEHVRLEGELSVGRHHRDKGALAVTGTPITATARAAWMFGSRTSVVRPFVSAGVLMMHSRGDWVETHRVRTWRVTKPGFETGLGLDVRGKGHMWWRPEVRFSGTTGDSNYTPGASVIESPILAVRAGLTVLW